MDPTTYAEDLPRKISVMLKYRKKDTDEERVRIKDGVRLRDICYESLEVAVAEAVARLKEAAPKRTQFNLDISALPSEAVCSAVLERLHVPELDAYDILYGLQRWSRRSVNLAAPSIAVVAASESEAGRSAAKPRMKTIQRYLIALGALETVRNLNIDLDKRINIYDAIDRFVATHGLELLRRVRIEAICDMWHDQVRRHGRLKYGNIGTDSVGAAMLRSMRFTRIDEIYFRAEGSAGPLRWSVSYE